MSEELRGEELRAEVDRVMAGDLWRRSVELQREVLELREEREELLRALKEIEEWFERMRTDHDEKLGHGYEVACENWDLMLQEPLSLDLAKAAIANAEKVK